MNISFHVSVYGPIAIGSINNKLCALELGNNKEECYRRLIRRYYQTKPHKGMTVSGDNDPDFVDLILAALEQNNGLELQLIPYGTEFQIKVWHALRSIPKGETRSYKQVAEAIDNPKAIRAVGTACGANPIAILIPCHRVIRSDGKEGEYRWGSNIKTKLLSRERSLIYYNEAGAYPLLH